MQVVDLSVQSLFLDVEVFYFGLNRYASNFLLCELVVIDLHYP